ncbi:MAG: hypothetical protein QXU18_16110, partial [Thermoplasmatales archaeon]
AMSKKESCLVCGMEGELDFNETYAFGFNATAGAGRKISEGRYNEDYKICGLCATEMELRVRELDGKNKENSVTVHLSIGDYVHPLDFHSLQMINEAIALNINSRLVVKGLVDKESLVKMLSFLKFDRERGKILDISSGYHQIIFLPLTDKISDTYAQFIYIEELLQFVKATGFKVRISLLTSSATILEQMFSMENAPPWAYALKLNNVRLDEVDDRINDIDAMEEIIRLKKYRDENSVLRVVLGLSHNPFSVYRIARELIQERQDWRSKMFELYPTVSNYAQRNARSESMEVKELVEPALGIMPKAPESSYEDERLIREAFETAERHKRESEADIITYTCGNIRKIIETKAGRVTREQEESVRKFAELFIKFYDEKKDVMTALYKKDVITAFAYEYHVVAWKRVNARRTANDAEAAIQARGENND